MEHNFFEKLDCKKAYFLGLIVCNIEDSTSEGVQCKCLKDIEDEKELILIKEFSKFATFSKDLKTFQILSISLLNKICEYLGCTLETLQEYRNLDFSVFVQNQGKEIVAEFFKAYIESKGIFEDGFVYITDKLKTNLQLFSKFFNIPCEYICEDENTYKIIYKNVNVVDLFGNIYKDSTLSFHGSFYAKFLKLINCNRSKLKFFKTREDAVSPTKANFSDVGYDITLLSIHKKINNTTILCNTGIKLEIPVSYYVEIVPRSSIIKTGYMLANSIGIIDCSYKGELFVALTKTDSESPDLSFPMKCCQLIMRKQIFPDMEETTFIEMTKRDEGGFGSSG